MDDNISKGCILPLAQSVLTGIMLGLVVLAAGLWAGWAQGAYAALAVGAAVAAGWWWSSIRSWRRYVFEEPEPPPLAVAEEPAAAVQAVRYRIELVQDQGRRIQLADLPEGVTPDQMRRLGEGIQAGASFSEAYWTGRGRPFSRSEFRALRDEFLRRSWLTWRDPSSPSQGLELTHAGKAIIRHFASSRDASPPLAVDHPEAW